MKVLFLSQKGDGLALAEWISREGHAVTCFIRHPSALNSGRGYMKRVISYRPFISESDLIICDHPSFGKQEGLFRGNARPVVGTSEMTDMIEHDPFKQWQLMEMAGLPYPRVIPMQVGQEIPDIPFERWLIRVYSDQGKTTILSNSREEWEHLIDYMRPECSVFIQEMMPGHEVCVEGFWNGRNWVGATYLIVDYKRLGGKANGPLVDSMGVVAFAEPEPSKLTQDSLFKLTPFLKQSSYKGPVKLRLIVQEEGFDVLGIRMGFSFDDTEAMMFSLKNTTISDFLFSVGSGSNEVGLVKPDPVCAMRLVRPPWPYLQPYELDRGLPIIGLTPADSMNVRLCDVEKSDRGPVCAGGTGIPLKVVHTSPTLSGAANKCRDVLKRVKVLEGQYSNQVGSGLDVIIPFLEQNGWIHGRLQGSQRNQT